MSKKALSRILYRSILRWAKAAEDVPFALRGRDLSEVLPHLGGISSLDLEDAKAVRGIAQFSFRYDKNLEGEDASHALETGLKALRLLNSYYLRHLSELRELRLEHMNKQNVLYAIGQVFIHKREGYKGVIYGWDPVCGRDTEWAAKMNVEHTQPFYKVLPDEDDCQRLFGSTRITKYVAQQNILPIQIPRRVTHRVLEQYFTGYSASQKRYVPNRQLQYEYPDEYNALDAVSCREDTNLLCLDGASDLTRFDLETLKRQLADVQTSSGAPYEPD